MCPVCLTAALIGTGLSGGGVAAALRKRAQRPPTERTSRGAVFGFIRKEARSHRR